MAGAVSRGLPEREGPTQALKEDAESKKGHRRREDHMAEAEGRGGEAGSRGRTGRPGAGREKLLERRGQRSTPSADPRLGSPARGHLVCGAEVLWCEPGDQPEATLPETTTSLTGSFLPHSCSSPFRGSRLAILALWLLPNLKRIGCSQLPGKGRRRGQGFTEHLPDASASHRSFRVALEASLPGGVIIRSGNQGSGRRRDLPKDAQHIGIYLGLASSCPSRTNSTAHLSLASLNRG